MNQENDQFLFWSDVMKNALNLTIENVQTAYRTQNTTEDIDFDAIVNAAKNMTARISAEAPKMKATEVKPEVKPESSKLKKSAYRCQLCNYEGSKSYLWRHIFSKHSDDGDKNAAKTKAGSDRGRFGTIFEQMFSSKYAHLCKFYDKLYDIDYII